MSIAGLGRRKQTGSIAGIANCDVVADAKKRISLRKAQTKYFLVKAFSDGSYLLEPRVLVLPQAVSVRTLKMLQQSVARLKKGMASEAIDLTPFLADGGARCLSASGGPDARRQPSKIGD